jgi:hypothetical protein
MSLFSRKHYEVIANCVAIVEERVGIADISPNEAFDDLVDCLKWFFRQDNEKFDEAVFDEACKEVK